MQNLKLEQKWLNDLIPQGLPYPSSTLISGEGGSGKPLIGFSLVYNWLKNGGNVIFISLQYPDTKYIEQTLKKLYNFDVNNYQKQISYIQFDYTIDNIKQSQKNIIKANLVKPQMWNKVIKKAEKNMIKKNEENKPGTLVFATALNLLLFSPTYQKDNLNNLKNFLKESNDRSYLFTVSTSAFREKIQKLENAADNLMFSEMGKDMQLFLRIERLINQETPIEKKKIPMKKEDLEEIKDVAEDVRKKVIPSLKNI